MTLIRCYYKSSNFTLKNYFSNFDIDTLRLYSKLCSLFRGNCVYEDSGNIDWAYLWVVSHRLNRATK